MSNAAAPREGRDGPDETIVRRNFEMLCAHLQEPMTAESIGGNAFRQTVNGVLYSCYAINGTIDARTGLVTAYGNDPTLPNEGEEQFAIIFGVPPVQDVLAGASERLLEIRAQPNNDPPSPATVELLMRMQPLWDEREMALGAKNREYMESMRTARDAPSPGIRGVGASLLAKLRKLFGR